MNISQLLWKADQTEKYNNIIYVQENKLKMTAVVPKLYAMAHYYTTCMYLPNPPSQAGCDTRSIFKQSKTGLNSEFFPSSILVALPRLKKTVFLTIYS